MKMNFVVEHMQGIAGIDEKATTTEIVRAETAKEAIEISIAGEFEDWLWEVGSDCKAVLENPEASNDSGKYCDYWLAEMEEELYPEKLKKARKDIETVFDIMEDEQANPLFPEQCGYYDEQEEICRYGKDCPGDIACAWNPGTGENFKLHNHSDNQQEQPDKTPRYKKGDKIEIVLEYGHDYHYNAIVKLVHNDYLELEINGKIGTYKWNEHDELIGPDGLSYYILEKTEQIEPQNAGPLLYNIAVQLGIDNDYAREGSRDDIFSSIMSEIRDIQQELKAVQRNYNAADKRALDYADKAMKAVNKLAEWKKTAEGVQKVIKEFNIDKHRGMIARLINEINYTSHDTETIFKDIPHYTEMALLTIQRQRRERK